MAHHAHVLAAHELFQSVAVVGRCDGARGHALVFTLGIAEQGEGQAVLLDELGVAFGVVFADAKHADAMGFKGRPLIAEVAGFFGAPRGVVLGIEIDNDALTAQVLERHRIPRLVRQGEIRCGVTDLKGHGVHGIGARA